MRTASGGSGSRRAVVGLGFTVLLLGILVLVVSFGDLSRPFGHPLVRVYLLAFGIYIVLALIERTLPPAGPRKSFDDWLLNFQINVFTGSFFALGGVTVGLLAKALNQHFRLGWIDLRFAHGHGAVTLLGAFLLSSFVGDFFYYWYHRTWHKVPFFWQSHKLHHMDTSLEAITVGRQSWTEIMLPLFTGLPAAVIFKLDAIDYFSAGVSGAVIGVLSMAWGPLFHANIKLHLGRASFLLNNPQLHRIHHSRLPQHRDKNFANYYPIWDVIFGTYYEPSRGEYPATGVEGEPEIKSFAEAQLVTLRGWWKMLRSRRQGHAAAIIR
jgi:sterol desaturase/sphingolipid hydroxylase (fatty acid hydroxylase superfamily)